METLCGMETSLSPQDYYFDVPLGMLYIIPKQSLLVYKTFEADNLKCQSTEKKYLFQKEISSNFKMGLAVPISLLQ